MPTRIAILHECRWQKNMSACVNEDRPKPTELESETGNRTTKHPEHDRLSAAEEKADPKYSPTKPASFRLGFFSSDQLMLDQFFFGLRETVHFFCRTSKMSHDRSGRDLWLCTDRDGCGRWLWRLVGLRHRAICEYHKSIFAARAFAHDN